MLLLILFLTELSAPSTSTLRKMSIITKMITCKTPNTKLCKTVQNINPAVKNTNLCEIPRNITEEWLDEDDTTGKDDLCEDDVQIIESKLL